MFDDIYKFTTYPSKKHPKQCKQHPHLCFLSFESGASTVIGAKAARLRSNGSISVQLALRSAAGRVWDSVVPWPWTWR